MIVRVTEYCNRCTATRTIMTFSKSPFLSSMTYDTIYGFPEDMNISVFIYCIMIFLTQYCINVYYTNSKYINIWDIMYSGKYQGIYIYIYICTQILLVAITNAYANVNKFLAYHDHVWMCIYICICILNLWLISYDIHIHIIYICIYSYSITCKYLEYKHLNIPY